MKKVTLEAVNHKKKEGKNGPYESVGILTKEYGEKWLNGFANFQTKTWSKGEKVMINVEENGEYLNFKPVSLDAQLAYLIGVASTSNKPQKDNQFANEVADLMGGSVVHEKELPNF